MSERSVVFYGIESEFLPIACKLIEKMYSVGERILFLCDNDEEVSFYNSKLWTFSRLAFIPSGNKQTIVADDVKFCHTWFSTDIVFHNDPSCLLHNGLDVANLNDIEKFQKVIDIFNLESIDSAKTRSKFYKEKNFNNQKVWIQSENSWKPGEL